MPDELDGELLRRFVLGDKDAFESLFRQTEVFHWILRIIRDASTAEDVLVEAFWRAYRAQARFDPTHSFGAWMRRIATNAARDHLRSVRPHAGWITTSDDIVAPTNTDCASANPSRSRSTLQEFGWSEENEAMAERFTEYLRQKATGIGEAQHQHPFGARYCRRNLGLERFTFWLRQDYVFLIEYARFLALAAARSPHLETMIRLLRCSRKPWKLR
jgi:RNA polymerase sigma factor (sigma-70 family)